MTVALIALTVALAGGATAASTMITGSQIKNGTITGADIKNGSLTAADIAPATRRAFSQPGPRGPQGVPGVQGVQGVAGGLNPSKLNIVTGPDVLVPVGEVLTATASCPVGQRATGGGFFSSITHTAASLPGYASWTTIINNNTSIDVEVNAYVICIAS